MVALLVILPGQFGYVPGSIQHLWHGDMRQRGRGRLLITGSIAGLMPGSFQAVYNGTKAFIDSFSFALRNDAASRGLSR